MYFSSEPHFALGFQFASSFFFPYPTLDILKINLVYLNRKSGRDTEIGIPVYFKVLFIYTFFLLLLMVAVMIRVVRALKNSQSAEREQCATSYGPFNKV